MSQASGKSDSGRNWMGLAVVAGLVLALALLGYVFWQLASSLLGGFIGEDQPVVQVPQVVGKTLEEGRNLAGDVELSLVVEKRVPSDEYEVGRIVAQQPSAEQRVSQGRELLVTVSGGPAVVKTPEVTGMDYEQAQQEIIDNRLVLGEVQRVLRPEGERGTVLWQQPSAGQQVSVRTPVQLLLVETETSETVQVPDVQGKKLRGAEVVLREAGLRLRTVRHTPSGATPGTVLSQSPPPDETVPLGGAVELEVAISESIYYREQREFLVQLQVPRGPAEQQVELTVTDRRGESAVYSGTHRPGDRIDRKVELLGEGKVTIRVDGRILRTDLIGYEEPPEEGETGEFGYPAIESQ